jgi:hypothetical protein
MPPWEYVVHNGGIVWDALGEGNWQGKREVTAKSENKRRSVLCFMSWPGTLQRHNIIAIYACSFLTGLHGRHTSRKKVQGLHFFSFQCRVTLFLQFQHSYNYNRCRLCCTVRVHVHVRVGPTGSNDTLPPVFVQFVHLRRATTLYVYNVQYSMPYFILWETTNIDRILYKCTAVHGTLYKVDRA